MARRGVRLHYQNWGGAGTPMVLLHGLSSQSRVFDLVAPRLVQYFRVVALDQRGHGESSKPHCGHAMASVAEDVRGVLDALDFERAIVVGHSWGGNVAVQFGAQFPNRVAALVLVDGGFIDFQLNPKMTWQCIKKNLAPPKLKGMPLAQLKAMLRRENGVRWTPTIEQIVLHSFDILSDQAIRPRLSFEHHLQTKRSGSMIRRTMFHSFARANSQTRLSALRTSTISNLFPPTEEQ
jgi:pimeloyl-ACP methyl ester carboxylesterase